MHLPDEVVLICRAVAMAVFALDLGIIAAVALMFRRSPHSMRTREAETATFPAAASPAIPSA